MYIYMYTFLSSLSPSLPPIAALSALPPFSFFFSFSVTLPFFVPFRFLPSVPSFASLLLPAPFRSLLPSLSPSASLPSKLGHF